MPRAEEQWAGAREEPRLVVPERFVIDEVTRERLGRQLHRAPAEAVGIVAETGELPPGASYRVHAEWKTLEPATAVVQARSTTAHGAVLVRPGVEFAATPETVEVPRGGLLVDPGAHVHDPWRSSVLATASELGRAPFTRRPLVVFVALAGDAELQDWARRLVNRLVRRDIEGRLAFGAAGPDGLHLTRPCVASAESIRALDPDIAVTLDARAAREVPGWCPSRGTVVVHYAPDAADAVELLSWQIDRAAGRVRARINAHIDAPGMSQLVYRLCGGPQPVAPTAAFARVTASDLAAESTPPRPAAVRRATVLTGGSCDAATARMRGLVDHLSASGVRVEAASFDAGLGVGPEAIASDVVVLSAVDDPDDVEELIAARRAAGRPTVADLGSSDVRADLAEDEPPELTPAAHRLAVACGLVTTPGGAVHRAVRNIGVRSHVVPTLLTRARIAALRQALSAHEPATELTVGWYAPGDRAAPAYRAAASVALENVVARRPDLRVAVVGDSPEAETLVGLYVQLWTPPAQAGEVADDLRVLLETSYARVPSVIPGFARGLLPGHPSPQLVVDDALDPDQWSAALEAVLDREARRAVLAVETGRFARSVYGPVASRTAANRFYGWARYQAARHAEAS